MTTIFTFSAQQNLAFSEENQWHDKKLQKQAVF
jgi:hypothetical protein